MYVWAPLIRHIRHLLHIIDEVKLSCHFLSWLMSLMNLSLSWERNILYCTACTAQLQPPGKEQHTLQYTWYTITLRLPVQEPIPSPSTVTDQVKYINTNSSAMHMHYHYCHAAKLPCMHAKQSMEIFQNIRLKSEVQNWVEGNSPTFPCIGT